MITKTSRSGAAIFAPRPPAISYPMQLLPYSMWKFFGCVVRHSLCRSPGIDPAAFSMIASGPETSLMTPISSPWLGRGLSRMS